MTTTSTFQGKDGNRNTSRVLAPPGGGSSNIFGAEERSQPAGNRYQNNDIFGQGDSPATQPLHTGKSIANKPVDDSAANVFGGARQASTDEAYFQKSKVPYTPTKSAEEEAQDQQVFRAKAKAATHNPLTWRAYAGFENVPPPACRDDHPTPKKFKGRVSDFNPITWQAYGASSEFSPEVLSTYTIGQASSHNPVTWQPNPGQDNADGMEPSETHAGRGRNPQQAKGGSYNILTGEDYGYQEPAARAGKKHIQQGQDTRPW